MDDQQSISKFVILILLEVDHSVAATDICSILDLELHYQVGPKRTALNTEILVEECGGFVEVEPSGQYLRLIHHTARDFFWNQRPFSNVVLCLPGLKVHQSVRVDLLNPVAMMTKGQDHPPIRKKQRLEFLGLRIHFPAPVPVPYHHSQAYSLSWRL